MNNLFFIDLYPTDDTHWDEWSNSVGYALGAQQLPDVAEDQWQEFACILQQSPILSAYGLPEPEAFNDWRSWAENVITVSNGYSQLEV